MAVKATQISVKLPIFIADPDAPSCPAPNPYVAPRPARAYFLKLNK